MAREEKELFKMVKALVPKGAEWRRAFADYCTHLGEVRRGTLLNERVFKLDHDDRKQRITVSRYPSNRLNDLEKHLHDIVLAAIPPQKLALDFVIMGGIPLPGRNKLLKVETTAPGKLLWPTPIDDLADRMNAKNRQDGLSTGESNHGSFLFQVTIETDNGSMFWRYTPKPSGFIYVEAVVHNEESRPWVEIKKQQLFVAYDMTPTDRVKNTREVDWEHMKLPSDEHVELLKELADRLADHVGADVVEHILAGYMSNDTDTPTHHVTGCKYVSSRRM